MLIVADQEIFSKPFEEQAQQSTMQLQQFYEWAKPLVKESLKDAAKHGKNFKIIDHYFPPTKPSIPAHLFDVIHIAILPPS